MSSRVAQRNEGVVCANVGSEVVMMSLERDEYVALVGIGPRVWELLREPITVDQISQRIHDEYDVNETTARADVAGFIDRLVELDLVRYVR